MLIQVTSDTSTASVARLLWLSAHALTWRNAFVIETEDNPLVTASHREVYSDATVKLITTAIREMARNPKVGRAEALRRSMLALIDKGEPHEAHPAYWAPFVVVGEGGAVDAGGSPPLVPTQVRKIVKKPVRESSKDWAAEFLHPRN